LVFHIITSNHTTFAVLDALWYGMRYVDEDELKAKKAEMEKEFLKNKVTKGDAGFIHDKRLDVDETNAEPSDWD
jgi:hypothetical protein